jgi:aldehyde dehydrogenase (NAD+)
MALALQHAKIAPGKLLVGGKWLDAKSGKTFPTVNPTTSEPITQIAEADAIDVDLAVQAARKAYESGPWPKMSGADRSRLLWRIAELIRKHADELAELETVDAGKPISDNKNIDVPLVAEAFEYYAGWTTKVHGQTLPVKFDALCYTLREPVGVVGMITPWNFPMLLASYKLAPALAMGCTMILKPASETPLTALKLGEIFLEAGVPEGVVNVITGKGSVAGMALVRHPGVDKIAFTGSTEVGQQIMREAAASMKRLTLELGGKSPNIVFADAEVDAAVRGAINGIFYNAGEICTAGSRLLVERKAKAEFVEKLIGRAQKMTQGDPLDPKTRIGPQVSENQMRNVLSYVEKGRKEGAKLAYGGERAGGPSGKGFFVQPTVFDDVRNDMAIAREEIFGPVASVIPFDDFDEVIRLGNDNVYGLAAGVWTRDVKKAHRAARALKAGTVWVNMYNFYDPVAPFGGYKMSGFGRELGEKALDAYTETKTVWVDLG